MDVTKQINIDNSLIDRMLIEVPNGTVEMRDDRIKKIWKVKINTFLLSKFPLTQDFYQVIMGENPSTFKGRELPVESVTWKDAIVFCNKLSEKLGLEPCYIIHLEEEKVTFDSDSNGFRLPTEAEWQYACQFGSDEIRYGDLDSIAWYKENSNGRTHTVGSKDPNDLELFDMLGNVWEWCTDIYDETVYGSYRIFRGGGWCDTERSVMATTRRRSHPFSFKIDDLGFRIARNQVINENKS